MLKHFSHNNLAQLIVDEAGQTTSTICSKCYLQIKKCYSSRCVGQALIGKLCQKLKVYYSPWVSSEVSLQHLADRNSLYQTRYGNITVGFLLLVYIRCQNPMFEICNKIAYDNKMIFTKI